MTRILTNRLMNWKLNLIKIKYNYDNAVKKSNQKTGKT